MPNVFPVTPVMMVSAPADVGADIGGAPLIGVTVTISRPSDIPWMEQSVPDEAADKVAVSGPVTLLREQLAWAGA
jgi:hypothetical protein